MKLLSLSISLVFINATTPRELSMLRYRRELQAVYSCDEALQSIYVSNYERSRSPCSCQVTAGGQTIVECNQYSYCKECMDDSVLNEPLCGEQSNRFVLGVSSEYCVKFGAMGAESNVCLSEKQQEESCQVTVDGQPCRSCQHVACEDGSTDFDLDCSNVVNEWGSDPTCQRNSGYNPIAGFTAGVITFEKCYLDPSDTGTTEVQPSSAPVNTPTELPTSLPISKSPSPIAIQDTSAPSYSPVEVLSISPQNEKSGLSTGVIIGVVVSSLSIIGLACGSVWLIIRCRGRVELPRTRDSQLHVLPEASSTKPSSSNRDVIETSSSSEQ